MNIIQLLKMPSKNTGLTPSKTGSDAYRIKAFNIYWILHNDIDNSKRNKYQVAELCLNEINIFYDGLCFSGLKDKLLEISKIGIEPYVGFINHMYEFFC